VSPGTETPSSLCTQQNRGAALAKPDDVVDLRECDDANQVPANNACPEYYAPQQQQLSAAVDGESSLAAAASSTDQQRRQDVNLVSLHSQENSDVQQVAQTEDSGHCLQSDPQYAGYQSVGIVHDQS
jgi:hypothetical protein